MGALYFLLFFLVGANALPQQLRETASPRIAGGENVKSLGEYPSVVAIYNPSTKKAVGAGAILTSSWIISSVDICKNELSTAYIVASTLDVQNGGAIALAGKSSLPIDGEQFCLIKLAAPLTLSDTVKRIILPPSEYEWPEGTPGDVVGWGSTSDGGIVSDNLKVIRNVTVTSEDCDDPDPLHRDEYMSCGKTPEVGVTPCEGDSGAPWIYNNKILMGVFYENLPGGDTPCSKTNKAAYVKINTLVQLIFFTLGEDSKDLLITDDSQVPEIPKP